MTKDVLFGEGDIIEFRHCGASKIFDVIRCYRARLPSLEDLVEAGAELFIQNTDGRE